MTSDDMLRQVSVTIDAIEQRQVNQESIDSIYENVCDTYYKEMDEKWKYFDIRNTKRVRRTLKPWWTPHLTNLFDGYMYRKAEQCYLKCTVHIEPRKPDVWRNLRIRKRQTYVKLLNKLVE